MKTNVGIELTDEERINLGQKYHGKKKPVTSADINKIVLDYIKNVLNARPHTIRKNKMNLCLINDGLHLSLSSNI